MSAEDKAQETTQTDTSVEVTETQQQEPNPLEQEVNSLRNKNQELLGDLSKLKQFRKTVDELGGLDTFKEIVTTQKEQKFKQAEESGDITAIKSQYQKEVESLQSKLKAYEAERLNGLADEKMRQAVQAAGGTWELVAPAMRKNVHAEMTDEGLQIEVLDDTGHLWIKEGRDATLDDLVSKLKGDAIYSKAFEGGLPNPTKSGSGATASRRRPEVNPWMPENRNLDAQTKLWLDNPDKARRMMAEAGVEVPRRR